MKRLKIGFVVLILSFLLFGCNAAPAIPSGLALEGRTVHWSEVADATGYVLKINDVEYPVATNQAALPEDLIGAVALTVKAVSAKKESAWSTIVNATAILQLAVPTGLVQNGSAVSWTAVPHALGYVVRINGVEYATTATTYEIGTVSPSDCQVLAVGRSDGLIVSSAFSAILRLKVTLATPANIRLENNILTWNAVSGAASYVIYVGDVMHTAAGNTIDLRYQYAGEAAIRVKAVSGSADYADSGYGEAAVTFALLTLSTPANPVITGGIFSFGAVSGATGYEIYVSGEYATTVTVTSYTIPSAVLVAAGSYLQVVAISTIHLPSAPTLKLYCQSTGIGTALELAAMTPAGNYYLENDIVLTAAWTPIPFSGVFDGAGFTISGLLINSDIQDVGFFTVLDGAIVRNLALDGILDVEGTFAGMSVGGLAGRVIDSEINGCSVTMLSTVTTSNGTGQAGGLFGIITNSTIVDCRFSGTMDTEFMITGGFVGKITDPQSGTSLLRCTVIANVIASGGEQTPVGGFVGMMVDNTAVISQCSAWGNVSGFGYVGGFVGYMGSGTIIDSYFSGDVHAGPMADARLVHAGGFAGRVEGYNNVITRCLAIATVLWENTSPDVNVGGFAGTVPGGSYATIFQNCGFTDNTLDRIGNPDVGRGDGIAELGTAVLEAIAAAAPGVWDFDGALIRLAWE